MIYIFVFGLFFGAAYLTFESKSIDENVNTDINVNVTATTFVIYKELLQKYVASNPGYTGVVTGQITLPPWLSPRNDIQLYAVNGKGYVYTTLKPGLMKELMEMTKSSSSIGVTNATSINTASGTVSKPGYIPANYVVYIL